MPPFARIFSLFPRFRLKRAFSRYQRNPGPRESLRLARSLLRIDRPREALEVAARARRQYAGDRGLLEVYSEAKERHARQLLAQTKRALKAEATVENFIRAADLSRTLGDLPLAFQYAREAEVRFPSHPAVQCCLGKLHYYRYVTTQNLAECNSAIEHLLRARELQPDGYGTLIYLAITALRVGERDLAVAVVEEALSLYPDDPRASRLWAAATSAGPETSARDTAELPQTSLVAPGIPAAAALPELSACIDGTLGLFLFDEGRDLLESKTTESELFAGETHFEAVSGFLDATQFDSGRAGMGEIGSWTASGSGLSVSLHTAEGLSLLSFFGEGVPVEEVDRQSARILEGSLVT